MPRRETGSRVGRYRIDGVLGEGATGIVYEATSEPKGERVALKILRSALSEDPVYRRRFEREARAAREVKDRHLVRVIDFGHEREHVYVAMELVAGESLERRLEIARRLSLEEVVAVTTHIGAALDAVHRAGLVHRDVKPGNVIVDTAGVARLTDFGLAKGDAYTVLTRPGQVLGTLDYLAPELIRGYSASPASDIYALGCVAYECLAGAPPFAHRELFDVAHAHLGEEAADPTRDRGDVPTGMSWVVLQALAKDADRRPRTATLFARMLRTAAALE